MGRNSTPLVCFAETMVLYYEMIQIFEMFEATDRFIKQTPHTLYLTLEKLNDWSVHFAEKSEKAVRFPRQLFTCVLSWLPFAATEWISINATKRCCHKKATSFLRWRFLTSFVSKFLRVNHKGSAKIRHFHFLWWLACSCGAATSYATFCACIILVLY